MTGGTNAAVAGKAELLQKVKALAERGVGGEADSAAEILDRLMKKYGITAEELDAESTEDFEFQFHGKAEETLLRQIIYMVTNSPVVFGYRNNRTSRKCRTLMGANCTSAQRIEIEFLFDFYSELLKREQKALLTAFVNKHRLFGDGSYRTDGEDSSDTKMSEEERMKMLQLMGALDEETPNKRLEA